MEDHFTEQLLLLLPPGSWTAATAAPFYAETKNTHTAERLEGRQTLSKLLDTKNILLEQEEDEGKTR